MSAHIQPNPQPKRLYTASIKKQKRKTPLVCLTAYSAPMATLLDPHVDILLVGDSLGMVVYGLPSTLQVTLEMMINHGAAVVRGSQKACVVVDLPFGSYQQSPQQAFQNAARVLSETGCQAVKLEGGAEMAETVAFLTVRGIPVMAHIGLQPQSMNVYGGFKVQGKDATEQQTLLEAAQALAAAGAFAVVIEGVKEVTAQHITENLPIPTIGIGASLTCDGQVLVTDDLLGLLSGFQPKFVKQYASLSPVITKAVEQFVTDVRARNFPTAEQTYS